MAPCRANYVIVARETTPERLVIRDLGGACPSVTNDAEAVIHELEVTGHLHPGRRVFYYDSAGDLDELLVQGGRFAGFAPGPRPTVEG